MRIGGPTAERSPVPNATKAPFTGTTDKAVWRNGSASDYESGGCSFEYYLGHSFFRSSPDRP